MNVGYARVSTDEQNLDLQRAALKAAGCEPVFEDQVSGMTVRRPGLDQALATLSAGDTLVVWRLDRLGRSLPHLIETIRQLGDKGAGFRSLTESIDTTTAGGRLIFHMMGALAEFERALIVERTRAGMKAAKARGVEVGRKRVLTPAQISHARQLVDQGESPSAVARSMRVGRSTLYRALNLRIPKLGA
ncbi:recombinase family protein [Roseomonas mucosa]|uniref:recombinase family protein n=1 Tax=Roseomonas mucosa TaxID=207340 RepID=UPI001EF5AA39|nr:recombinase family protein [Roseomonas mucosa]MCG7354131.1 recombinase family protein [Roseomonas mucosa]MDT8292062.1 recombinase family protein [Roseomonas mucosa]